jgi:undecaprenyl-diphosphatase
MLSYSQVFILGLLQGLTELFPVSSLGHIVLIPALLHWGVNEHAPMFIEFIVAMHFATAVVLLVYFWKDWVKVVGGFFRLVTTRKTGPQDVYARLAWLILIATIPVGLIGFIFQTRLENLFSSPKLVAVVLILNGILLYGIEFLKRNRLRTENTLNAGDTAIDRHRTYAVAGAYSWLFTHRIIACRWIACRLRP